MTALKAFILHNNWHWDVNEDREEEVVKNWIFTTDWRLPCKKLHRLR